MVSVTIYLLALAIFLTVAYIKYLFRVRREGEPPIVPGHFLWGNGAEFSEQAVHFLHRARKSLGDIFTIRLLHQHMTVILDPHCFEQFAKEKNFDFEPIQQQVNMNVFGFTLRNSRKVISEAGKKVNGKYLSSGFDHYAKNLLRSFTQVATERKKEKKEKKKEDEEKENMHCQDNNNSLLPEKNLIQERGDKLAASLDEGEVGSPLLENKKPPVMMAKEGLRNLMARTFFDAVFYTIFGRAEGGVQEVEGFTPRSFHANFDIFHKFFNYLWLGVPVYLFPKASQALKVLCQQPEAREMMEREGVSEYIKLASGYMLEQGQSQGDILAHNLVFLHVNYNTFRVTYWCVYHLMEKPEVRLALERELAQAVEERRVDGQDEVPFTLEDIDRLPLLDSFLKETLRIATGVFMVRKVMEDTPFTMPNGQTFTVRKGDKVAMYPPAVHMDPEIFEDPETFKFDRFVDAKFYKYGKEIKNPITSFGSLCPGRRQSQLHIKWFLMNTLNSMTMQLQEGERTELNTQYYGHEILPPTRDVQVLYGFKPDAPKIAFTPRRYYS